MPARLPTRQVRQLYECPSCIHRRTFSLTLRQSAIGPESPRYIDVPQPPQQTIPDRTRLKGILPVPKDVFGGKKGIAKADAENIKLSTQLPQPRSTSPTGDDARLEWKQRMADMRRRNLKEGLMVLKNRRVKTDNMEAQRRAQKQIDRDILMNTPEREDERLTKPSIDPALKEILEGDVRDPGRQKRLRRMRNRVMRKEENRQAVRQDHLHTLYMQARSFITTEQQLNSAIDAEFGTPELPREFATGDNSINMWSRGSFPMTVNDMLNAANGVGSSRGGALDSAGSDYGAITKRRLQRMAEELTGGKMDDKSS